MWERLISSIVRGDYSPLTTDDINLSLIIAPSYNR
jgi:hypothetical protein